MHETTAWKPHTIQPFLVAVLDFAVLVCRRYGMSPFWLSPFWFVAVLIMNPQTHDNGIYRASIASLGKNYSLLSGWRAGCVYEN